MKVPVTLLSLVFAGLVFAAMPAGANQETAEKKDASAANEVQWQGNVIRFYNDKSMLEIRGGLAPSSDLRKVAFDSSTQWTKQGKPGKQDEIKQGAFVILVGHVDDSGVLHATRIDLRRPR